MDLEGLFILSGDWLAGDISGSFEYLEDEADIEVRGSVALSVNTYSEAIRLRDSEGGSLVDVEADQGVRITAEDFTADVGAGSFTGSFEISSEEVEGDAALRFDIEGLDLRFGATREDPMIQLGAQSGSFYITTEGIIGEVTGLSIDAGALSFSGTPTYSFNTTSASWAGIDPGVVKLGSPAMTYTAGDLVFRGQIDLSLPSEFTQGLLQDQYPRPPGHDPVQITLSGASLELAGGSGSVSNINGSLFAVDGGVLGALEADFQINTTDLTLNGLAAMDFNTTASAFSSTLHDGTNAVPINVPAGPYLAFGLDDLDFSLLGSNVSGDIEVILSGELVGESPDTILIEVEELSLGGEIGSTASYELTNLTGFLLSDSEGVMGSLSGGMALSGLNEIVFTIPFASVELNTRGQDSTYVFGDQQYRFRNANYFEMLATGASAQIGADIVQGNFTFGFAPGDGVAAGDRLDAATLSGSITDASLALGSDGFVALEEGLGAILIDDRGTVGVFSGSVDISVPDVGASGLFTGQFTTRAVSAGESLTTGDETLVLEETSGATVALRGDGVSLALGDQIFEGSFLFEAQDSGEIAILGGELSATLSSGGTTYFELTDANGFLLLTEEGSAAQVRGEIEVLVSGFELQGSFTVKYNSLETAQVRGITLGGTSETISIEEAGPYLAISGNRVLYRGSRTLSGNQWEQCCTGSGRAVDPRRLEL